MLPDLIIHSDFPSPNYNNRTLPISIAVVHYTAMIPAKPVVDLFQKSESQVSAHYVIGEDGAVFSMVDEQQRAWHAGVSHWGGIQNVNSASLGFELVNPGFGSEYRPFARPQIRSLKTLLHYYTERYNLLPWDIVGHSDVAPTRKQDPGHLFPWKELAQEGLGLWPQDPLDETCYSQSINITAFYEGLIQYGYTSLSLNATDNVKRDTTLAFQRHFQPEIFQVDGGNKPLGIPDAVTVYRLNNLLEQKKSWLERLNERTHP